MNNAPIFDKTLLDSTQSKLNFDHWDTVMELWDAEKYRDAVIAILDYADGTIYKEKSNADKTEFTIPHGSVVVTVNISETHFNVKAPFLQIPEKNAVPLLRQIAQINFSPLNLTHIALNDNLLEFQYNCPLDLCEPYKIYDVLREICLYADNYDDEFIKKFKAKWIVEPIVKNFEAKILNSIYDKVQLYIKSTFEYINFYEGKRQYNFVWENTIQCLMQINYYVAPQGILRTDIEKAIGSMQNQDLNGNERISIGNQMLTKLQNYDKDELTADLYISDIFIPVKYSASLTNIQDNFQQDYENAYNEMNNKNYNAATFTLRYAFFNAFFHANIPNDIAVVMTDALQKSSGKPWKDAALALWSAMKQIINGNLKVKKKGGFFRRLFG